jgi:hypothetical protein
VPGRCYRLGDTSAPAFMEAVYEAEPSLIGDDARLSGLARGASVAPPNGKRQAHRLREGWRQHRVTRNATSLHTLQTSLHQPPDGVAQKQSDGRFPCLAVRRSRLDVAGSGDLGECKREPQIILKTDKRSTVLELSREGKFTAKSSGWDKDRLSFRATSSRSQLRTGAGCSRTCPRARDRRRNWSDTIFRTTETALQQW